MGFLFDESKATLVTAFDGTQSRTLGACVLAVSVGGRQSTHSFQVVGVASHKKNVGLDVLRDLSRRFISRLNVVHVVGTDISRKQSRNNQPITDHVRIESRPITYRVRIENRPLVKRV